MRERELGRRVMGVVGLGFALIVAACLLYLVIVWASRLRARLREELLLSSLVRRVHARAIRRKKERPSTCT